MPHRASTASRPSSTTSRFSSGRNGQLTLVPRLLHHLSVPRKGLVGPWAHAYPHFALPGPQIGFLQEMVRWWDRWLKGIDNDVMDEPMLRAWMCDSVKPASWRPACVCVPAMPGLEQGACQ